MCWVSESCTAPLRAAVVVALSLALVVAWGSTADARVGFGAPIRCQFDYYQYLTPGELPVSKKHDPIVEWVFRDLGEPKKAKFISGGDVGSLDLVHRHQREFSDGISLILTQGSGAHLFTIWPDGTAYWTKHNSIFGVPGAQQFRGACENIRGSEP